MSPLEAVRAAIVRFSQLAKDCGAVDDNGLPNRVAQAAQGFHDVEQLLFIIEEGLQGTAAVSAANEGAPIPLCPKCGADMEEASRNAWDPASTPAVGLRCTRCFGYFSSAEVRS